MSDSVQPHGQQPTRLLCPRDSLGKNTGVSYHFLLSGGMRACQPKKCKEKRGLRPNFGCSFYKFFLLPRSLPYVSWASQEGCLFSLRFSLRSSDLPLFSFVLFLQAFPFLVFQPPPFWTPFSYSNYLTPSSVFFVA